RISRHDDDHQVGIDFMHAALQLDTVSASHFDVNQGGISTAFRKPSQRVIDDQQISLLSHTYLTVPPLLAAPAKAAPSLASGKVTMHVVPRPDSVFTSTCPWCRSTILWLIASPSPTPFPLSFVVMKGSKMC